MGNGKENISAFRVILQAVFWSAAALLTPVVIVWILVSLYDAKCQFIARDVIDPKAAEYIAQKYPGNDFVPEDAFYNFKDNCYTVKVSSSSSPDTYFEVHYDYKTYEFVQDTYWVVTEGYNIRDRLLAEYEHRVEECLKDLEKLDYLYVDYYHYRDKDETPPLSYHYGTQGLNPATLTLDQPYDDSFGFHYGNLEITLLQSSESCNIQTALRHLQEIDSLLTESGVGYYVLELSLKAPSSKSEFHIYGVRREDLHCEDPLSRLQQLWDEQEAHRQEIKAGYKK